MKRVFNPAPILFKGSGFYVTDSRKKESPGESAPATPASKESSAAQQPAKDSPSKESAA